MKDLLKGKSPKKNILSVSTKKKKKTQRESAYINWNRPPSSLNRTGGFLLPFPRSSQTHPDLPLIPHTPGIPLYADHRLWVADIFVN